MRALKKSSAPWHYDKPVLDLGHRLRGYPEEALSLLRSLPARLGGRYTQPQRRFVIFGRGRSGSTLLVQMLDQHSRITCLDEVLKRRMVAPEAHLERCIRLADKPIRGFKLLSYQVTQVMGIRPDAGYIRHLQDRGYRVIYIHRANHLRLAISNMFARKQGQYHRHRRADAGTAPAAYHFSCDEILDWLQGAARRTVEEATMLADVDYLDVLYERDLEPPAQQAATLERAFRFLGVDSEERIESTLKPVTPRKLSEIIENFDEVRARLVASGYAHFLEE